MVASSWLPLLGLAGAVFLGSSTQRITGVGFALVASPFLVVLLGPFRGVIVINAIGTVTAFLVFLQVRKVVEYRRVLRMYIPALVAVIPGAWAARLVPSEILSVIIGVLILVALTGSIMVRRTDIFGGSGGAIAAGAASGFMNVTAGVGGPAVSAYAVASRWPQKEFAASIQLYFALLGLTSLIAKWSVPALSLVQVIVCIVALVFGIVTGQKLHHRVSARTGRVAVVAIAFAGAILLLLKGSMEWIQS